MKKFLRISAMLLMLCTLLGACTSSGGNSGTTVSQGDAAKSSLVGNIPCEFPLTKNNESLNVLTVTYDGTPADNVFVWQKYREMTGVNINWTSISKDDRKEAVSTALINKKSYDLIMRCKISADKLTQYGENGLLLDLAKDDLLKKNAPNCWAYLQSHPDTLASVTNPDGAIYSLPQVNSGAELRVSRKIYINKTWLENVNMQVPTTTEELYQLLKVFKEQDANGNGDKGDEIPMCFYDWASVQDAFFGAFGLGNRGLHNQIVDCDEATGKVRLIEASDSYKEYLKYLNRLYTEGLMDKYIFTITSDQWENNAKNDLIGVFAATNLATLPADKADNWVAVEEALTGPNGDKLWAPIRANFHSVGAAVIPSTCQNPELALRWLDYFWTDEGTLFYHMGVENETYVAKDGGTYDYAPSIYKEIESGSKSFDDVVAQYSPYPGGSNPTVEIAPYFMGGEMDTVPANAAKKLFEYGPKEYWPSFTFTKEESEVLSTYQSDISKYTGAMRIDFITGAKSFDQWDEYTAQVDKLGRDETLAVYQAAVDRYHAMPEAK